MELRGWHDSGYDRSLEQIPGAYTLGRVRAVQVVNTALTDTYWQVGRRIGAFEQGGEQRAEYGKVLLVQLVRDLTLRHGKGFSRSNLIRRQFYLAYPKSATLSHQFSWLRLGEMLKIDDPRVRGLYEQQTQERTGRCGSWYARRPASSFCARPPARIRQSFRRYEEASLRYTGIESHRGLSHVGLYDTVVAKD